MQEGIYDINLRHQRADHGPPSLNGLSLSRRSASDIGSHLFDLDNDGVIGIMDILHLLGLYDTTCD